MIRSKIEKVFILCIIGVLIIIFMPLSGGKILLIILWVIIFGGSLLRFFPSIIEEDDISLSGFEIIFENEFKKIIKGHFGKTTYDEFRILTRDTTLEDLMMREQMIALKVVEKNVELRFFLYLKISRLFLKLNEFERAIKYLELAILIKPKYLLTYIWLAKAYDLNYKTDSAINIYNNALKCKATLSDEMKIYIEAKRNYLIARGPRKKGLKHATYIIS